MPRRRPTTPSLSNSLLSLLILLPIIAASPQQQQQHGVESPRVQTVSAVTVDPNTDRKARLAKPPNYRRNSIVAAHIQHERALATVSAPAASDAAVRAPSGPGARQSGSLTPRLRSLQDWAVEDFVLLATVNGQIHARDRYTGRERWTFDVGRSMVETYHNPKRVLAPEDSLDELEKEYAERENPYIWIIEPTQDGNLYVYSEGPNPEMHKINMTVKQLAEEFSPWQNEGPPAVVYTASKKTHLYTLNARTGKILRRFSSGGSTIFNDTSCERTTGFEASNRECHGTLTLGQTEYEVEISDLHTGEVQCILKYFEWTPNKRDSDLHNQYQSTMDNKYVLSKYDGSFDAIDRKSDSNLRRPLYSKKLDSPVARVYDVARPFGDHAEDAPLIILPQPLVDRSEAENDVWVNCTETGSWYAMSELHYPSVTDRAPSARCYSQDLLDGDFLDSRWEEDKRFPVPSALVGVHSLNRNTDSGPMRTLPAPTDDTKQIEQPVVSATPIDSAPQVGQQSNDDASSLSWMPSAVTTVSLIILGFALGFRAFDPAGFEAATRKLPGFQSKPIAITSEHANVADITPSEPQQSVSVEDSAEKQVRFTVPENASTSEQVVFIPGQTDPVQISPTSSNEGLPEDPAGATSEVNGAVETKAEGGEEAEDPTTPKKKKAHRGQRGGRKRKKSKATSDLEGVDENAQVDQAVEQANNLQPSLGLQPDEETVGQTMTDVNDPIIKLGKLTIDKGKVLGTGSGGTMVFEGKWKERVVAVKRMLPQHFDFANQEIDYLQRSDPHPNVIRFFDDERDHNFLYIAIEKCQASLWDLYRECRGADDPITDVQNMLKTEINRDVPGALKQLAKGINHLHGFRIIHRDVKPQNILIAYPKASEGSLRLVISDFGLSKTLPDNASTLIGTTNNAGTIGWKAPELITTPKESDGRGNSSTAQSRDSTCSNDAVAGGIKRAADIFSLGCVFYYVLTGGSHPYDDAEGWMQLREMNIKKDKKDFRLLEELGPDIEEARDLLNWMLLPKPELRPTATEVLQHPFFWSPQTRLNFLCDVSDHWEREERDPPSPDLIELELSAATVIADPLHPDRPLDFLSRLDKKFTDTLGKQRKYSGHKLLDLLRALRNKKNHYEDMPADVQARVGSLPGGYLAYWTGRFPALLISCYVAVQRCGLMEQVRFRPYFRDLKVVNVE